MAAPLTPSQIATVKATAPVLKEHGTTITTLFYKNMIDAHPELHNMFNVTGQVTGAQPRALAGAVLAYAMYVDDLGKLTAAVERIAHKHASLKVQPEHYPIVGKFLIEAVAAVLGDACTPEIGEAWTAAYACLAEVFVNREQQLYASEGNWTGWRRFKIQRKVVESKEITSFYFVPEDGGELPLFLPGQYISLQMYIRQLGHMQPRQYSLSDAPRSDYYRISVKKEGGKQVDMPGLISNMLHDSYKEGDVVELSHPTGDFFVDPKDGNDSPIALISAGVGITPMVSILNTTVASGSQRKISWVHGAHSTEVRAFASHVQDTCKNHSNIDATIFVTNRQENEVQGVDYHYEGRVDLAKVEPQSRLFIGDPLAQYYICGPGDFMRGIQSSLINAGVGGDRIHLEVFGVGNE